jgi:3',5'-cyclic AMP phosphodiesterase CpdA
VIARKTYYQPQTRAQIAVAGSATSYANFFLAPGHGPVLQELTKLAAVPRAVGDTFRFVVTGDQHLGLPNFASYLVPLINAVDADFVMLVGDETNTGLQGEWDSLFDAISFLRAPAVLQIPGNHEYKTPSLIRQNLGIAGDYRFDYGGWRFICMDDGRGYLTTTQLAWLQQVLATAPGPTAIFMHVPPAGVTSQWDWAANIGGVYYRTDFDGGAAELRELCRAYGVKVVYAGHIHAFDAAYDDNGVLYIVTGGGGTSLSPRSMRKAS